MNPLNLSDESPSGESGVLQKGSPKARQTWGKPIAPIVVAINDALEREGAFYLFTLRLIPVVPFFVVNAVMGLTKIRATTFRWMSQIGMLPGTAAFVYAGSTVPSL